MNANNLYRGQLSSAGAAITAHRPAFQAPEWQRARPLVQRLGEVVFKVIELASLWMARRYERRRLMALDDHLLKDIGISRSDAMGEWEKPFWRN